MKMLYHCRLLVHCVQFSYVDVSLFRSWRQLHVFWRRSVRLAAQQSVATDVGWAITVQSHLGTKYSGALVASDRRTTTSDVAEKHGDQYDDQQTAKCSPQCNRQRSTVVSVHTCHYYTVHTAAAYSRTTTGCINWQLLQYRTNQHVIKLGMGKLLMINHAISRKNI